MVVELRRSVVVPVIVALVIEEGVVGVGVGAVCVDVGLISTPSGMVLRSLLVPVECWSSSSTARRRPRQRRDLGGSGLILGARRVGASPARSMVRPSLRLGVMTPGFSCCAATACTLSDDADAGSSCMPSRWIVLSFRRDSGASDEPRESKESILVGDVVPGESGMVLVWESVRVTWMGSISMGESC